LDLDVDEDDNDEVLKIIKSPDRR